MNRFDVWTYRPNVAFTCGHGALTLAQLLQRASGQARNAFYDGSYQPGLPMGRGQF